MSTPFLLNFSRALVARLRGEGLLELSGPDESVASYLADRLAVAKQGDQLISTVSRVLIACPDVDELFADNDDLKRVVQDLAA